MEFEFTLIYKIAAQDQDHDEIMLKLARTNCTDALVGLGVAGHMSLEFIREAPSAQQALLHAIKDVKRALPAAQLIEASPDWVGLSGVADLLGVTRQNMRKLMLTHSDSFPSPVHTGSTSVWHLAEVLRFMQQRKMAYPSALYEVARVTLQLNLERQIALHSTEQPQNEVRKISVRAKPDKTVKA